MGTKAKRFNHVNAPFQELYTYVDTSAWNNVTGKGDQLPNPSIITAIDQSCVAETRTMYQLNNVPRWFSAAWFSLYPRT